MSENNIDPEEIEKLKREQILVPLESAEQLRDWVYLFFDIYMPLGHVYPESNSSSVEAMWKVYCAIRDNTGDVTPGYTLLSSRDSYKCSVEGSLILGKNGFKKIEEVKVGETIWSGFNWEKVSDWIDDGVKKSIDFTLKNGIKLSNSPIHRHWCLRDGTEQWIEGQNILETDLFCVNTATGINNHIDIKQKEYDEGYFLGLLAGDGSVSAINSKTHPHFGFTSIDSNLVEWYYNYVNNVLKEKVKPSKGDAITHCTWGVKGVDKIKKMGVKAHRSWEKEIPQPCYESHSRMIGFINGLFDTDGSFNSKNQIEIPITAKKLIYELQKVLVGYGVNARANSNKKLYEQKSGVKQNHLIHRIIVNGNEHQKMFNIGFKYTAKKAGTLHIPKIHDAHDSLPIEQVDRFLKICGKRIQIRNRIFKKTKIATGRSRETLYKSISVGKLGDLLLWCNENIQHGYYNNKEVQTIREMESIVKNKWFPFVSKKYGESHFYDLTVENDHSYWANGCISHNTLSASILEVLLLIHFRTTIAHCSAILSQSQKSVEYCTSFMRKILPYLTFHGWKQTSANKMRIELTTDKLETCYIQIIILTMRGANSSHTNLMFVDEVDLCDPAAYQESKMIPGVAKGVFPITVRLSTRKFAFGLMEKEMAAAASKGEEIVRWNILDVTEHCPSSRCKPDKPMHIRYIPRELPLRQISKEEYLKMDDNLKNEWQQEKAYEGCLKCPLFSVCKRMLHEVTPKEAVGDLFKPIPAVINIIKAVDSDVAEAQLLCHKPSSKGLIYPRFSSSENILTVQQAWEKISGLDTECTLDMLIQYILDLGIEINAGVDWGYTNEFAVTVAAILPGQQSLIIDMFAASDLELDDCVEICKDLQQKYRITKFWCDQAYPAYIKTFNRNGLTSPKFIKDVPLGIESVRGRIVNSNNKRSLFLLKIDRLERLGKSFGTYHWKIDAQGNITDRPDHTEESDVMDSVRYLYQCIYGKKSKINFAVASGDKRSNSNKHNVRMTAKISELAVNDAKKPKPKSKKRILFT